MPCSINWSPNGTHVRFFDKISTNDVIDTIGSLYGNLKFDSCKYQLIDLSEVTEIVAEETSIPVFAALTKQQKIWNNNLKVIFVTCKPYHTEYIDSYIKHMSKFEIRMEHVQSIKEAKQRIKKHLAQITDSKN